MKRLICLLISLWPISFYAAELQNLRPVTPESTYCLAPQWSPLGQLYCSTPKFSAILKIDLENSALQTLSSGSGLGYQFAFAPNGNLFCKQAGEEARELWMLTLAGEKRQLATANRMGNPVWFQGAIRVLTSEGVRSWEADGIESSASAVGFAYRDTSGVFRLREGKPPQRLSPPGLEAFLPKISPAGDRLVYETLGQGLFLVNLESGAAISLGTGNNACWSADGVFLFFDRTQDDGHRLTAGDLFRVNRDGNDPVNLTEISDLIATHPALSPDGKKLAFEAEGRIWLGDLLP